MLPGGRGRGALLDESLGGEMLPRGRGRGALLEMLLGGEMLPGGTGRGRGALLDESIGGEMLPGGRGRGRGALLDESIGGEMLPRGRGRGRGALLEMLLGGGSGPKMEGTQSCASACESPSLPAPGRGRGKIFLNLLRKRDMQKGKEVENEDSILGHQKGVEVSTPGPSFNSLVKTFADKCTLDHPKVKEVENEDSTTGHQEGVEGSTPGPSFNSLVKTFADKDTLDHPKGGSGPKMEGTQSCASACESPSLPAPGRGRGKIFLNLLRERDTQTGGSGPKMEGTQSCASACESPSLPAPGRGRGKIFLNLLRERDTQKGKEVENEDSILGHQKGVEVSTPGPSFNSLVKTFADKCTLDHPKVKEVENEDSTTGHQEGVEGSTPGPSFNSLVKTFADKDTLDHPKGGSGPKMEGTQSCASACESPSLPAPGRGRGKIFLNLLRERDTQKGGSGPKMEGTQSCASACESPSLPAPGRGRGKIFLNLLRERDTQKGKEVENEDSILGHQKGVEVSTPGPSFNSLVKTFADKCTLDHPKGKEVENEDSILGHQKGVEVSTPGPSFNSLVKTFADKCTLDHPKVKEVENEDSTTGHQEGVEGSTPGPSFNSLVKTFADKDTLDHPKGGSGPKMEGTQSCASAWESPSLPAPGRGRGKMLQILRKIEKEQGRSRPTMCAEPPCATPSLPAPGRGRGKIFLNLLRKRDTQKGKEVVNEDSILGHQERVEVSTPGPSFNSLVKTFADKCTLDHPKVKEVENEDSTTGHQEGVEVSTPGPSSNSLVKTFADKDTLDHPKGLEDNLKWFFAITLKKTVGLEYLDRLLTEPVGDTEALIYSFTPAQSRIRRLNIELARIRVLLDCGSKIDTMKSLSAILDANTQIPDGAFEWEKEIIRCQLYWFNIIQNQIRGLEHAPVTHTPATTSSWSNTYVKALFNGIFSVKGCKRALVCLLIASCDDEPSLENLELLFLKAQVLGKLRYLEQWPASRWQTEETLVEHVIRHLQPLSTKWAARAQVYLAEFLRLRGYRLFLEMRKCVNGNQSKINNDYKRSIDLIQLLEKPLRELGMGEAMVWRAEQLFRMPTSGDWEEVNEHLAQESLKQAMSIRFENAYTHRVMAFDLEKYANKTARENMSQQQSCGEKIDGTKVKETKRLALKSYDAAIKLGSTKAQLEKAGLLYRLDRSQDMLPVLQGLPDARLHIAAYLTLCKNNTREAQQHLKPFLKDSDMYPPLLVHYPICTPLAEPINLAHVVNSDARNSPFLQTRTEILEESNRLTTNKKFSSKTYVKRQHRKKAYPKRN